MIRTSMIAALALAGSAGAALAGPMSNPPTERTICIDVGGQSLPVVCRVPASRLDKREDFCLCHQGARVIAPVCGPGQKAPAENLAYERARRDAARDGSLLGDLYRGQPMCVAARDPLSNN
ncbi:hypothetical protein [Phenylobacterium sp.]|uniref:hypothetical protein n=1 Tax=Phenylobacterium sp. TaxID=1871053 RepID=UPI00271ECB0D|nr:hypothetical protein [Phenylobacterium sp.]MDO8380258.1 hypothetical protein [Phenylobacterium sp.]